MSNLWTSGLFNRVNGRSEVECYYRMLEIMMEILIFIYCYWDNFGRPNFKARETDLLAFVCWFTRMLLLLGLVLFRLCFLSLMRYRVFSIFESISETSSVYEPPSTETQFISYPSKKFQFKGHSLPLEIEKLNNPLKLWVTQD